MSPNRLAKATSPYLLQHADNPVDWYQWGEEAGNRAQEEDKPILLSVGYATCHWCHVMAHESFEDPETAELMNELFVNVKVDREERPDVDAIYMDAVQAMTGRGGWPMTVFLTPDGEPFYAGTYFPKESTHGLPSFRQILRAVAEAWEERREEVVDQARRLTEAVSRQIPPAADLPGQNELAAAYAALGQQFDPRFGGFGGAPKFPQEPVLEFLLRSHRRRWAPEALEMVTTTLLRMSEGGIYDHLGGGFARYSVDERWLVPHFEKMLYDNAQLARLYLRAWQVAGDDRLRQVALETLEYLLTDLRHPDGGFFSGEDADSEGEEGTFYVFSAGEFREILGDDAPMAADYFGVTEQGNFEGSNVLHLARSIAEVADRHGVDVETARETVADARARLLAARNQRERPGLDDKVVTSWNGLAMRGLAEAGAVLGEERYTASARTCARFLLERLRRDDGRLLRAWRAGPADVPGFLEDYASLAVGLLTLYQVTGEQEWYGEAVALIDEMVELFYDPEGGFHSTGRDAERLIIRPRDLMDNPLPSGTSLAAEALLLSSLLSGEVEHRRLVDEILRAGGRLIGSYPSAVGHLLSVLDAVVAGPKEVAIVGPETSRAELEAVVWESFRPDCVVAVAEESTDVVPLLADRPAGDGQALAYVCRNFVCDRPVEDPEALREQLAS